MGDIFEIEIEQQAMLNVPIYESHKRGKNWCAVIHKDPAAPGGLARQFLPTGRGDYYYLLDDLLRFGTPVEFGADYYSGGGKPHRARWYGVVTALSEAALTLERYDTATQAINATKGLIDPGQVERRIALELEAVGLRERLSAIETELATLPPMEESEEGHSA